MVFGLVVLAALVATGADYLSLRAYQDWNLQSSNCGEETQLMTLGLNRAGESALKEFARDRQASSEVNDTKDFWDISIQAEGRTLSYTYRFKRPWPDQGTFYRWESEYQKDVLDEHCSEDDDYVLKLLKATETHTFYNSGGERMSSFSMKRADCPQR